MIATYKPTIPAYCEVFFPCTETLNPDGSGSMVDVIRGATYTAAAGGVGNTLVNDPTTPSNSIFPTMTASVELTAGTFPNFKQRSVVTFGFGRIVDPTQIRTPIGQGDDDKGWSTNTGGLITMSFGGTAHILINGSSSPGLVAITDEPHLRLPPAAGTDVAMCVEYEPYAQDNPHVLGKLIGTDGNTFGSGASETILTGNTVDDAMTWIAMDLNPGLNNRTRFEGLAFYGFAAFSFDGSLPSREILDAAYAEMMADWIAGNRRLPSQFSYRERIA